MFIPTKEQAEAIVREHGTPVFVTDAETIRNRAAILQDAFDDLGVQMFYAIKANYNPHIVRIVQDAGVYGIDAISPHEVRLALELGYNPEQIVYTPSNASTEEIRWVGEQRVLQNPGSLSELRRFSGEFPGQEVSIRISPDVGAGESEKITTGTAESKFGLVLTDLGEARRICDEANVTIVGIHSHIGSGFYESSAFRQSVEAVLKVAGQFPTVRCVDFGGGFGARYRPEQEPLDLASFAAAIREPVEAARAQRDIQLRLEPGKFLVAESTVLLARITTVKQKGEITFVGLDTGFNHLIRPAFYGTDHHVVNLSRGSGDTAQVQVVGNICESGDIFNRAIDMVQPQEGDLVAILTAGAYGSSMSSNYNMRELAAEVLLDGGEPRLTRRRQTYDDIMAPFEQYEKDV